MSTTKTKSKNGTSHDLSLGDSGDAVVEVQSYLQRYGYLGTASERSAVADDPRTSLTSAAVARSGSFDEATADALARFQQMVGIPVTGVIDMATTAKMSAPRCGNPDIAEFVATGGRWPTRDLVYAFQEFSPDLSPAACRQAVHQAFSVWAGYVNLTFREGPIGSAHIIIRFTSGDHGDGFPFTGPGGVLAHAFFPPAPPSAPTAIQGDTHFDEAENWTISVPPGAGQFDLTTVAVHEFGHALGLNHSPVVGSVMEAIYAGPRRLLHGDDIGGMTSVYGAPAIAHASWTHGTSVTVELPGMLDSITRFGFFTRIVGKAKTTNWFHFAIPTPVIVNGARLTYGPALLRARTGGANALVRDVHLWDGDIRVAAHDGVNISGAINAPKFGVAHAPKVLWGAGISVGVTFGAGNAAARTIDFVSAGIDFKP